MKYTSLSMAAAFGNAMASASSVSERILSYYIANDDILQLPTIHLILYSFLSLVNYCIVSIMIISYNQTLSNTQPHGGGGGGIHPKKMDVGAISFGHQVPVMMKEAAQLGRVDGNVSI